MASDRCTLCSSVETRTIFEIEKRRFVECSNCDLLFCSPARTISVQEEIERYLAHENCFTNQGYVQHLERLVLRLVPHLAEGSRGIDFGCGHTPVLSMLFEQNGFIMENYDPFFKIAPTNPETKYDFLSCSEVVEHFESPRSEFMYMKSLVKPKGFMAVMTNLREGERRVPSWWYLKDPTHTCFYSAATFKYISQVLSLEVISIDDDVTILQA